MEELGEFTLEDIKDCTHGIIVFDPKSGDDEMVEMVHWVGYWEQPGKEEFDDLEKEYIKYLMKLTNNNKRKTAKILNISRTTLYNKLAKYNIQE